MDDKITFRGGGGVEKDHLALIRQKLPTLTIGGCTINHKTFRVLRILVNPSDNSEEAEENLNTL